MVRTNIELDEKLLEEAFKLTQIKTRKALVHFALQEIVLKAKRKKMLELAGKVTWKGSLHEMRKSRI